MFHVVTGGSGSGKSTFAEEIVCKYYQDENHRNGTLFYIATMIPYGKETQTKIQRHRMMRAGKDFVTIECYNDLENLMQTAGELSGTNAKDSCVLLECMSNLTANEMFGEKPTGEQTAVKIISGIQRLRKICNHLVVVTNEVFSESDSITEEMKQYKEILSVINRKMSEEADVVTEVVYGIPFEVKGMPLSKIELYGECNQESRRKEAVLKMIIGGAYQGKRTFAENKYGIRSWIDGTDCLPDEIYHCEGIYHFELYIKRMMILGKDIQNLPSILAEKNPQIMIVTDEIGCGLVPVDRFEREYREQTGRICTEVAALAKNVDRVICGIGISLKGEQE